MAFRYTIPEISALTLLSAIEEKDGKFDIVYDAAEPSRECLVKWTQQDDCPMFHQAMRLLKGDDRLGYADRDALSEVFVYIDFSGIFDRRPVGKVAELQRKAEWMFRPDGLRLCLRVQTHRYIAWAYSEDGENMEKLIFDEGKGLWYELQGDYYIPCLTVPEDEQPVGLWGQRHLHFIREHRQGFYTALLLGGKLNSYLVGVDSRAGQMLDSLVTRMAAGDGITEQLKEHAQADPSAITVGESVLGILYECHNENHPYDNEQIKDDFHALYEKMNGMPLREMDKIIYPVCTLCRDHEKSGFISGIQIGFVLSDELMG